MSEAKFTSEFLSAALKIQTKNNTFFQFDRIGTDSRTLEPTDFYIPLKGEKFDGHDFVPAAIQKGVRGVVVREDYKDPFLNGCFVLRVPDTLKAFRRIAAKYRQNFRIPVIAVAGSVGKTTTKELLASLLSGKLKTAKTEHSQNGFIGIPTTLVSWEKNIQAAVVEIGIDAKGAMEEHLNLVHPTHGLLTALGPEHLEQLVDMETVFQEEIKLFSYLHQAGGKAFLNLDDPILKEKISNSEKFITFSFQDAKANFFGKTAGKYLEIRFSGHLVILPLPLPGIHNAKNLLGAAAIAIDLGLTQEEMVKGLESFQTPQNRMEIKETRDGIKLVMDYYNANPTSMEGAFQVLESEFKENPKILVLGDMLELGEETEIYHRRLSASIEKLKPRTLYLFGPQMKCLEDELGERKEPFVVEHFQDKEKLAKALWLAAKPGDVVLFKGSRGMMLEEIFKYLPTFLSA